MRAAMDNDKIWFCTPKSIIKTLLLVSELGLPVHGHNNGLFFEVRNAKTSKQGEPARWEQRLGIGFGYNALITLVQQDGVVVRVDTGVVREGDIFEYELGSRPFLRHIPSMDYKPTSLDDTGPEPVAFYAIAELRASAYPKIEIMPRWEVARIRRMHADEKSGAWNNHFAETGRKTPLRRLCKTITTSPRLASALAEFDQSARAAARGDDLSLDIEDHGDSLTSVVMGSKSQGGDPALPAGPQIIQGAFNFVGDSEAVEAPSAQNGHSQQPAASQEPSGWPEAPVKINPDDIPF
jgi:phage RecT family recombinase